MLEKLLMWTLQNIKVRDLETVPSFKVQSRCLNSVLPVTSLAQLSVQMVIEERLLLSI